MTDNTKKRRVIRTAPGTSDTHPLEQWLAKPWVLGILKRLTAERSGTARPHLYRALDSYGDRTISLHDRVAYWPIHYAIDRMRGTMSRDDLRAKLAGHPPTLRGILATARSVAEYGLTTPQRWQNPLFAVWNFTNRCNLRCRHCYQSSGANVPDNELTLAEKLNLVDQFGKAYMPMIAFAGGEPTISPDLEPVLERCYRYGIHSSIATHGGLLTPERCVRLAERGVRYVEVSLDSVDPERHDRFRGMPGMWRKAVDGLRNVIATPGLRAGIAMCVHVENLSEVNAMIRMAIDMGVSCFAHFNFIPVGRGREMIAQDITPQQRDELLHLLHEWLQTKKIGVISTAPQFGRYCLQHAGPNGLVSCSHAGNASGTKARVVARYLGGCGAGRTYACVQPNGDITPCVYMPQRVMGNIREKSFTDIFQQSPWWDLFCHRDEREGHCGTCDFRNFCGGCRARADAYYNRLDHVDPGCVNNQDYWQRLVGDSRPDDSVAAPRTSPPIGSTTV